MAGNVLATPVALVCTPSSAIASGQGFSAAHSDGCIKRYESSPGSFLFVGTKDKSHLLGWLVIGDW
jgi:hypothetical protein